MKSEENSKVKKSTNRRTLRANPKVTPAIMEKAKKAVKSLKKRTVKISPVLKKRTLNKARKAVQSIHNPKPIKDKFGKINHGIAVAFIEISKSLPLKIALQLDNLRELIIKDVNTIHQQAIKEESENARDIAYIKMQELSPSTQLRFSEAAKYRLKKQNIEIKL